MENNMLSFLDAQFFSNNVNLTDMFHSDVIVGFNLRRVLASNPLKVLSPDTFNSTVALTRMFESYVRLKLTSDILDAAL